MARFIAYSKLSKRQQRATNNQLRGSWGVINPVTRRPSIAYNRTAEKRRWLRDDGQRRFFG